jgi:hypothetical protein
MKQTEMEHDPSAEPPDQDLLLDYLGSHLSADVEQRVEEHLFACAHCTSRLQKLQRMRSGVMALMRGGRFSSSVSAALVATASASGLRVRRYHVAPGQTVPCTAGPEDDYVVIALDAELGDAQRVDLSVIRTDRRSGERLARVDEDLCFDREEQQIVLLYPGELIRRLPRTTWHMEAAITGPEGDKRRAGPYQLDHTPWEDLPAPPV